MTTKNPIKFKLLIAAVLLLLTSTMSAQFDGGDGSEDAPYQISSAQHLWELTNLVKTDNINYGHLHYQLTANIEVNSTDNWEEWPANAPDSEWIPIGSWGVHNFSTCKFTGVFDGNGFEISGIYINQHAHDNLALFGMISSSAVVKNVTLTRSFIKANIRVAGIVAENYGSVINCHNMARIEGNYSVGGIVGDNFGYIGYSSNSGNLYCEYDPVGGICGTNILCLGNAICGENAALIEFCYNTGSITGSELVAGIAGYSESNITNCYNTGVIIGDEIIAGIVGVATNGLITNCYNVGSISGTMLNGEIAGILEDLVEVNNCFVVVGSSIPAIGENDSNKEVSVSEKTIDSFYSGKVAWLLNRANNYETAIWGHSSLNNDELPSFIKRSNLIKKVVNIVFYDEDNVEISKTYILENESVTFPSITVQPGFVLLWNDAYDNQVDEHTVFTADQSLFATTTPSTLNKPNYNKVFSVTPNPFSDFISLTNSDKIKSVSLIDMKGNLVISKSAEASLINTSHLTSGIYVFKIESVDEEIMFVKVIKK